VLIVVIYVDTQHCRWPKWCFDVLGHVFRRRAMAIDATKEPGVQCHGSESIDQFNSSIDIVRGEDSGGFDGLWSALTAKKAHFRSMTKKLPSRHKIIPSKDTSFDVMTSSEATYYTTDVSKTYIGEL
jgi:hypothetical protein